MKRASNVDRIQEEIVNALRGRGATVQSLGAVGKGCPDLLVGYCGDNTLLEVKTERELRKRDGKPYVEGQLNEEQKAWHAKWRGQVAIVRGLEDLKRLFPVAFEEAGP